MSYTAQRDAILAHAKTAAAAVNAQWKDVAIGAPIPTGNRCVRLFYGGESAPAAHGRQPRPQRRAGGRDGVAHRVLVDVHARPPGDEGHRRRDGRLQARSSAPPSSVTRSSAAQGTDLEMGYAEPDYLVIGGTRWAILDVEFVA